MAAPIQNQSGSEDGNGGFLPAHAGDERLPAQPPSRFKDSDGNEISQSGKLLAGFLLIMLTVSSAFFLIAHWPDRLPAPYETLKPLYTYEWFNVRLAGIVDSGRIRNQPGVPVVETSGVIDTAKITQTTTVADSAGQPTNPGAPNKTGHAAGQPVLQSKTIVESDLIHINTILLILVALGGFIGNMIHVATSFTTFIGNGQNKKSWELWYVVKPFTAAALAVAIYFVFRGGFLNMSDDSTNINLYGLMTISILAGLFTDRTTIKLKEVFEVLLRPKEDREDPLTKAGPQITGVAAEPLEVEKPVTITLNGKHLDQKTINIKIEGQLVKEVNRQPTALTFAYTLQPEMKDKDAVLLEVLDEKGEAIYPATRLQIKKTKIQEEDAGATTGSLAGTELRDADEELLNQEEFGDPDIHDEINKPQE